MVFFNLKNFNDPILKSIIDFYGAKNEKWEATNDRRVEQTQETKLSFELCFGLFLARDHTYLI